MIIKITNSNIYLLEDSFIKKETIKHELNNNPFAIIKIYIEENIVKGYIYYSDIYDRIEINNIEVVETQYLEKIICNNKIGTKLLENLIKENKDITLEVKITNEIAINLYKKFNFKKQAIRKGYYNGIDGVLMERKK